MIGAACITAGLLGGTAGWVDNNGALIIFGFLLVLVGLACWLWRDSRVNCSVIYDQDREMAPWQR